MGSEYRRAGVWRGIFSLERKDSQRNRPYRLSAHLGYRGRRGRVRESQTRANRLGCKLLTTQALLRVAQSWPGLSLPAFRTR